MEQTTVHAVKEVPLNDKDIKCYRFRRRNIYLGICGVIYFLSMTIFLYVIAKNANINVDTPFFYQIFGILFLVFIIVFNVIVFYYNFWFIISYVKSRLFVSDKYIETIGVFQNTMISLDEVMKVEWKISPSRCVVFGITGIKIVIEFDNYSKAQRKEIIDFIREKISRDQQDGWDRFYECNIILNLKVVFI